MTKVTQRGAPPQVKTARCRMYSQMYSFLCVSFFYFNKRGEYMTVINGKEEINAKGITVKEYLLSHNYKPDLVAIELNSSILPKSKYETYVISESDTLEIVTFVGGG